MRHAFICAGLVCAFWLGRLSGPERIQYEPAPATVWAELNLLLADGWVVIDPDGCEVERFDE